MAVYSIESKRYPIGTKVYIRGFRRYGFVTGTYTKGTSQFSGDRITYVELLMEDGETRSFTMNEVTKKKLKEYVNYHAPITL